MESRRQHDEQRRRRSKSPAGPRGRDPSPRRHRHRSRSPGRHRSRSPRKRDRSPRRKESYRDRQPELSEILSEAQRDRRTVFVRQLAQRVRSDDLRAFCEAAGRVRDVRIVYDRISNRSKGVAYVEYVEEASVQKALELTGQKLCGIPAIVELTETEKNRLAEEAAAETARRNKLQNGAAGDARELTGRGSWSGPSASGSGPAAAAALGRIAKVQVANLHPGIGETELRRMFEPFGDVDHIRLGDQEAPGVAVLHFRNPADAAMAVDQMNGFELAKKHIRVGLVREKYDGTRDVQYGRTGDVFTANLDDSETKGLTLNAKTRTELMQKLARDPVPRPGPSPCVLLSGMYDPAEETELQWEYAIADEVREEVSRWGALHHVHVPKTADGEVWIQFLDGSASQQAVAALNGRWFGGRQIKAVFVPLEDYQRRFPGA